MLRLVVLVLVATFFSVVAACSEEDEPGLDGEETVAPSLTELSSTPRSSSDFPTPMPTEVPIASVTPVAWSSYEQPASDIGPGFSVTFPSGWFRYSGQVDPLGKGVTVSLYSFDRSLSSESLHDYPSDSMKVDLHLATADGLSSCGPGDGEPTQLAGFPATKVVEDFDPPHPSGLTRAVSISAISGMHCIIIAGAFAQLKPDEESFGRIVDSFRLLP